MTEALHVHRRRVPRGISRVEDLRSANWLVHWGFMDRLEAALSCNRRRRYPRVLGRARA